MLRRRGQVEQASRPSLRGRGGASRPGRVRGCGNPWNERPTPVARPALWREPPLLWRRRAGLWTTRRLAEISQKYLGYSLAVAGDQGIDSPSRSPPGERDQPEERSTRRGNSPRWLGDEASGIERMAGSVGSVTSTDHNEGPLGLILTRALRQFDRAGAREERACSVGEGRSSKRHA